MKITINRIISVGFSLLVILMLAMSFSSYRGIKQLNEKITISGEQIAPMLSTSGSMGVALLSANKTLMQFLIANQSEALAGYEATLVEQEQQYLVRYNELLALASLYPQISELLNASKEEGNKFFEDVKTARTLHKDTILAKQILLAAAADSKKLSITFKDELNDVATYGDDHTEISAATTLEAQLDNVIGILDEMRHITDISVLNEKIASVNKTFTRMSSRISKLENSHKTTADNFKKTLSIVENILSGEGGFLPLTSQKMNRVAQMNQLHTLLSVTINSATDLVNELMATVEKIAKHEGERADQFASNAQQTNFLIGLISILIAIATGTFVYRCIRKPLKEMMAMLSQMAEGDMSQRITIVSQNEFGDLSTWINQLADKLSSTISEISNSSAQVSQSISDTSQLSKKTRRNMENQKDQTSIVVSSMQEMTNSVNKVTLSAEQAQQAVIKIDQKAQLNQKTMFDNVQMIQELAENMNDTSEVVDQLNIRSESIGKILEVISGIASKTNLLALNAAIESARAGEHGRGFAVVADEVRNLAQSTQEATQNIQEITSELQEHAAKAVSMMGISSQAVNVSMDKIEQSGQDISNMVEDLTDIRHMSEAIALTAEEQNSTCNEISDSVKLIATMSEECSIDAIRIAKDSKEMITLADHQISLVKQFKLQ
jgi:methyl-accepting chemotaxis protein